LPNILWFSEISKNDIPKVGGKGANLGEMANAGFPVPDGFCVTAEAYFNFLKVAKLKSKIEAELKNLSTEDTKKLNQVSKKIKKMIIEAKMSAKLAQEIKAAYRKIGTKKFVAVRSSATAEDLPDASFAGQHATFLNVIGEDAVVTSVQKCWATLFEPRAIFYRVEKKFPHMKVGLSAIVQEMVQSDISGVMFTIEPLSQDENNLVIESIYGLGEAIVSGSVTPDHYVIDKKNLEILEKEIVKQTWKIAKVAEGDKHIDIAPGNQKKQKLPDPEIKKLAEIGIKIEKHYDKPQDIEWAYDDGKMYIVQSRPITALNKDKVGKVGEKKGQAPANAKVILTGAAASLGLKSGPVKVIHSSKEIDKIKEGDVLVTEMTNPEFVPAMKRAVAIVTDTGGRTSHAAIVSRELGIPCVVGSGSATAKLKTGDIISVDGGKGVVYEGKVAGKTSAEPEGKLASHEAREVVPITGTKVYVNLAEKELAEKVAAEPVDGVGLLRAEFMIADIGEHPKAMIDAGRGREFSKKLAEGIATFCRSFAPRPVVYRATDFKTNEYKNLKGGEKFEKDEANPMIGYRGAMRYRREPDVFKLEIDAIRKVRGDLSLKNLWLMIPFVRTIKEMAEIMEILKKNGLEQTHDFKLWMMVEVPSTTILIDKFLDLGIDGVSIGSNDLTQLILGADRDNAAVAEEFDERDESVVWAMKRVIAACKKRGVTVSICGQAPSVFPEITEIFVREGATSVSVNPDVIIQTKKLIASIERRILLNKVEGLEEDMSKYKDLLEEKK
jgi:pyruvate,water dikinase